MDTKTDPLPEQHPDQLSPRQLQKHLLHYLKGKGFTPIAPEEGERNVITGISRQGIKEVIELRFDESAHEAGSLQSDTEEAFRGNPLWRPDLFLLYCLNRSRQYLLGRQVLAVAMPDTTRARVLLREVESYFIQNNLQLKAYLVASDGPVTEMLLNNRRRTRLAAAAQQEEADEVNESMGE
ncbi:MAG TPA: hypothetical protein VHK69_00695 [Chitinophagaceae bacterium]|jgi:hypothetical protein|nr:hypothetical protein [Chitinophagaceae bacterium]